MAGVTVAVLGAACCVLAGASHPLPAMAGLGLIGVVVLLRGQLVTSRFWLFMLVTVVMLVPARRYSLAGSGGFALEPYRVVLVGAVAAVLAASVLRGRRISPPAFILPVTAFLVAILVACTVNYPLLVSAQIAASTPSYILVFVLVLSAFLVGSQLARDGRSIQRLITTLLWLAGLVALLAIVERVTGTNYIWRIGDKLPLRLVNETAAAARSGGRRSFGSAQHPIALAVMLSAVIPLAFHQAKHGSWPRNAVSRRIVHMGLVAVLLGGVGAAVSRTSVVALGAGFLVLLLLRPAVAAVAASMGVLVGLLGYALQPALVSNMLLAFLDVNSLLQSQYTSAGTNGQGRLADLGPATTVFRSHPFFGTGFGRISLGVPDPTLQILDNQYLLTLLDAGLVGLAALILLLWLPVVRMGMMSMRRDVPDRDRDLALALAVSFSTIAVAAYLFDFFAFQQAVEVWGFLLVLAAWLLRVHGIRPRRAVVEPLGQPTRSVRASPTGSGGGVG